ncbi:lipopolysaccharide biosynthesis protein [Saccharopolyspora sp. NPDC002376]
MTRQSLGQQFPRFRLPVASSLVRNTGWAFAAEAAKLLASVVTFVVITHLLAPSEYGVYVGTLGMLWFLLPFASAGTGYLLLARVAGQGVDLHDALGRANGMVIVGGLATVCILASLQHILLPQCPLLVLVPLALAEIVFGGLQEVAAFASQATEKLRSAAAMRLLQGASRLLAATGLVVFHPDATLTEWAWLHLASAALTGLVSQLMIGGSPGGTIIRFRPPRFAEVRLGFSYSVGFGADKIRESADVMLLLRIGTSADAGIYGAATRLINVAVTPLKALIASSNARFFAAGARSVTDAREIARRITFLAALYGGIVAVGILVAGPAAMSVLSSDYAAAADALRMLAVWPLAVGLESYVATAMTAIGHQRFRVASMLTSTVLNIVLNVVLIPSHGWGGAIIASLVASAVNSTMLWSKLLILAGSEDANSGAVLTV